MRAFFESAYWLQRGEFYPEIHAANVDKLASEFRWNRVLVDALYRILPHFDYVAQEAAKRVASGEVSVEVAFEELCFPVFYYIPEPVRQKAWKLHLDDHFL